MDGNEGEALSGTLSNDLRIIDKQTDVNYTFKYAPHMLYKMLHFYLRRTFLISVL